MRSRFEFYYKAPRLVVASPHASKWSVSVQMTPRTPCVEPKAVQCSAEIEIVPEVGGQKREHIDGSIFLTIDGRPEETRDLAFRIAQDVAEHISFLADDFRIEGGLVGAIRIPESPEEEMEIGDGTHWAELHMVEMPMPVNLDPRVLNAIPAFEPFRRAVAQFNAAKHSKTVVDYYLGMFRVVELLFSTGRLSKLNRSPDFRARVADAYKVTEADGSERPMTEAEITEEIDELVSYRHQCAHLNEHSGFGLTTLDPEVMTDLEPRGRVVENIVREEIFSRMRSSTEAVPIDLRLSERPLGLCPLG